MMEQSPFKMDTFPHFFSGRCTTDTAEAAEAADTAEVDTSEKADTSETADTAEAVDTSETDAEQPMMVIGQDKITLLYENIKK